MRIKKRDISYFEICCWIQAIVYFVFLILLFFFIGKAYADTTYQNYIISLTGLGICFLWLSFGKKTIFDIRRYNNEN